MNKPSQKTPHRHKDLAIAKCAEERNKLFSMLGNVTDKGE